MDTNLSIVDHTLHIGVADITLSCEGDRFMGLGEVKVGNVRLRSARIPMFARLRTPFGVEFVDMRLYDIQQVNEGSVVLKTTASARQGPIMEWMLHTCRPRVATGGWGAEPLPVDDLQLSMTLAPASRAFGPFQAEGFCYQYAYACPSHPVYMITDHGSWEPGGSGVGNSLYLRGTNPPVSTIADADEFYSTEWYLPGIVNPNIFQFKPFQTGMQGFTLTVHAQGALVTWATKVAHIRTLLEKRRGADEIEHWHEHCGDLGPELTTSPMEVLWIPGDFSDDAALANLYFHVNERVSGELHRQAGIRRERITTYATMEEWGLPDLRRYIDLGLPRVLEAGVKTVYIPSMFQNNMNTFGVGNMCCTVDYKIAESVGEENVKAFCAKAHTAGAKVQMWGNTALSAMTLKCILPETADRRRIDFLPLKGSVKEAIGKARVPFVRNAFGAIEADHYTPVFCQLNLLDPVVREYWHTCWKDAHDRLGIDGIFLDSSFNMTSDKFHWSYWTEGAQKGATIDQTALHGRCRPAEEPPPKILSQYFAHLEMVREMQHYGYHYSGEDTGVFGLKRSGPDVVNRMKAFCLWADSYCGFDPQAIREAGEDPDTIFFKGLAYRVMWNLCWDPHKDELSWRYVSRKHALDAPSPEQLKLLAVFNEVEDQMRECEVLPGESAVLYRFEGGMIVWAVQAGRIELDREGEAVDLVGGGTCRGKTLAAEARHVYRIT